MLHQAIFSICIITTVFVSGLSQRPDSDTLTRRTIDTRSRSIADAKTVQLSIKKYVEEATREAMQVYQRAGIESAIEILDKRTERCRAFEDRSECLAGLRFSAGYLYQLAADRYPEKSEEYQENARRRYEYVLKIYPDNKAAHSNLAKLDAAQGLQRKTVRDMKELSEQYPEDKVEYLVRIGDLYLNDQKLDRACRYFTDAYREDPYSELACNRLVKLYTHHNYECTNGPDILDFALSCDEAGFSNLAEEVMRRALEISFASGNQSEAEEALVLWANLLASNDWVSSSKIEEVMSKFPVQSNIRNQLAELLEIANAASVEELKNIAFWTQGQPLVYDHIADAGLRPKDVFIRILYNKGQSAMLYEDFKRAESFWKRSLAYTDEHDNTGAFARIAGELALLYHTVPVLDTDRRKLDTLVRDLFAGKGGAYGSRDLDLIRTYHITLGTIFYQDTSRWEGNGAGNARFQLSRALSPEFGPIINPVLRRMLGDVYMKQGSEARAMRTYLEAIQDELRLDRIAAAERSIDQLKESAARKNLERISDELSDLDAVISWRKELVDPSNTLIEDSTILFKYLARVNTAQDQFAHLDNEFVQLQFFKGLADLGKMLPPARKVDKQIVNSMALERISTTNLLASRADYQRVRNIKNSLDQFVKNPRTIANTQLEKKSDRLNYDRSGYRFYEIPGLSSQVCVPVTMFEMNDVIRDQYKAGEDMEVARLEYVKGKFKVIKSER